MRAIIVDDEPLILQRLEKMLKELQILKISFALMIVNLLVL